MKDNTLFFSFLLVWMNALVLLVSAVFPIHQVYFEMQKGTLDGSSLTVFGFLIFAGVSSGVITFLIREVDLCVKDDSYMSIFEK